MMQVNRKKSFQILRKHIDSAPGPQSSRIPFRIADRTGRGFDRMMIVPVEGAFVQFSCPYRILLRLKNDGE